MKTYKNLNVGDFLYYYDSRTHDFYVFRVSKVESDKHGITIFFPKNGYNEWFCTSNVTETKAIFDEYVTIFFNKEDLEKTVKNYIKELENNLNNIIYENGRF